ncbi:hypothetical protein P8452_47615 [Trifolium repens]|nr:hypothetical protein P8452_47615 [Trifolium repens]
MDYSKSYMFFVVVIFVILCSQVLSAIHVHDESPITVSHHNGELGVDIPSDEELRLYFDSFDKDHNGFVNADEILYGSSVRSDKPITIEVAKQVIRNIDNNGDGKTSYEEFHKYVDALLEIFY